MVHWKAERMDMNLARGLDWMLVDKMDESWAN
jgi:hypothetical protein